MKKNRIQEIKKLFLSKKQLTNVELCQTFGVSIETIRRDLNILEREGFINKMYGGARLAETPSIPAIIEAWDTRKGKNETDKKNIAGQIAALIPDGCTVFLDTGTSVFELVSLLREKKNLTVLTSSLRIASELGMNGNTTVYIIGGLVKRETLASSGYFAKEFLSSFYRIDYAVISCDGFLPEYGTTEYSSEMAEIKHATLEKAEHIIAAVDHSKFGITGCCLCCKLDQIETVVTDTLIPADSLATLEEHGIHVIVASPGSEKEQNLGLITNTFPPYNFIHAEK